MGYDTEFPEEYWPDKNVVKKIESMGFQDNSWHNDIDPHWASGGFIPLESDTKSIEIWIAPENKSKREFPELSRFRVVLSDRDTGGGGIGLYVTESDKELFEYLAVLFNANH